MAESKAKVGIIGGGPAGLSCAQRLREAGLEVRVFDKGRRLGGRISTRLDETSGLAFDHGAQFFTTTEPETKPAVDRWLEQGVIAEWKGRFVRLGSEGIGEEIGGVRYVGVPTMATIAEALGKDLDVQTGVEIGRLFRKDGAWRPRSAGEEVGEFDWVVVATPSAQAAQLLWPVSVRLAEWADASTMYPVWSVMIGMSGPADLGYEGAFIHGDVLSWAGHDSSKPGRDASKETWVLHATRAWSKGTVDREEGAVARELLDAFRAVAGKPLPEVTHLSAHRWRFAQATDWSSAGFLVDDERKIGVCGDWCVGSRLEAAMSSGHSLADRILSDEGVSATSPWRPRPERPEGSLSTASPLR